VRSPTGTAGGVLAAFTICLPMVSEKGIIGIINKGPFLIDGPVSFKGKIHLLAWRPKVRNYENSIERRMSPWQMES